MGSKEWHVAKSEGSLLSFEFSSLLNVTFKTGKSLYRNMKNNRARMYLRTEIDKLQDDQGWKVKVLDDLKPELRVLKAAYMYNKSGTLRGLLKAELTREGNESLLKHLGLKEIHGKSPLDFLVRSSMPLKRQNLMCPLRPVILKLSDGGRSAFQAVDEVRNDLSKIVRFLISNPSYAVLYDDAKILVRYHKTVDRSYSTTTDCNLDLNFNFSLPEAVAITNTLCSVIAPMLLQKTDFPGQRAEFYQRGWFLILEPKLIGGSLTVNAYSEYEDPCRGELTFGTANSSSDWNNSSNKNNNSFLFDSSHLQRVQICQLYDLWNEDQQMHYFFLAPSLFPEVIKCLEPSVFAEGGDILEDRLHRFYQVRPQIGVRIALVMEDIHMKVWTTKYLFARSVTLPLGEVHWEAPHDQKELTEAIFWKTDQTPSPVIDNTRDNTVDSGTFLDDFSFYFTGHALAFNPIFFPCRRSALERCNDTMAKLDVLAHSVYKLAGCLVEQLELDFSDLMEAVEDIRAQRILRGLEEGINRRFDIGLIFEYDELWKSISSLSDEDTSHMVAKGRRALAARIDLFEDEDILSDAVLEAYLNASRQEKCDYVRADDKSIDKEWVNEAYGYGFAVPCRSKTSTIVVDATDNFYIGIPSCKTAIAICKSSTLQQRVTSGDVQLFQSASSSRARKALLELCAVLRPDPKGEIQYSEHARQELMAAANNGLIFSLGRVVDALRDQVYRNRKVWQQQKIDFRDIMDEAHRIAKLDSDEERAWLGRELASVYARLGMFEEETPYSGLIRVVSEDFCSGIGEISFTEPLRGDGIMVKEHRCGKLISGSMFLSRDGCWMGTPKYNVARKKGRIHGGVAAEPFRRSFIASCIESNDDS